MEDILKLILEKIDSLSGDIDSMKKDMGSMKSDIDSTRIEMGSMKSEIVSIKSELGSINKRLESMDMKIDKIGEKLDVLEASNAERHIEMSQGISKIQQDVIALEAITGKNMTDIAILKAVK